MSRPWLVSPAAVIAMAGFTIAILPPGCNNGGSGGGSAPTLDARGGACDSEYAAGVTTPFLGNGGSGGYVRVLAVGAGTLDVAEEDTTLTPAAANFPATVPTASGFPFLDVAPGEKRTVSGSQQLEWLRVQQGGTLVLDGNTFFVVYGDVEIAGNVRGVTSSSRIKGSDFTVDADGIINVTGTIDCSGHSAKENDQPAYDPVYQPGGQGGELYISSIPVGGDSRQPRIFVGRNGKILSNGGKTFSKIGAAARAGKGGQILVGCVGDIVVAGRVSAHGGQSKYTEKGFEGDGGAIEIVASGGVSLNNVRQINANGGYSTGALGGVGGTIILESNLGSVRLDPVEVLARGGAGKRYASSIGGDGGTVTLKGDTVTLDGTLVDVGAGNGNDKDGTLDDPYTGGTGGVGGTAQVRARTNLYLGSDPFPPLDPLNPLVPVEILANGGKTSYKGLPGGDGGNVKLINTSGNQAGFTFDGLAEARGGNAPLGLKGTDGRICTTGAGLDATVAIIGSNNFPNSLCTQADLQGLTESVELSCDDTEEAPSQLTTSTPVVIGVNFFRVLITEGMRVGSGTVGPAPYLTVTTKGALDGDLDLYVGPESAFGSFNPGDYTFGSSTGSDTGINTVCIDTSGNPDTFVSVMVVEKNNFIEDFGISVGCSSTGCN